VFLARAPRAAADELPAVRPIPAELTQRFQTLYPALRPSAREWVDREGQRVARTGRLDVNGLRGMIEHRFPSLQPAGSMNGLAIEAMVFVVLMQAERDGDQDLRTAMADAQAIAEAKQQVRALLADIQTEIAAAPPAGSPSTPCGGAFCRSLSARLAEISSTIERLRRPVRLTVPAEPTYADLALLRGRLERTGAVLDGLASEQQAAIQSDQAATDRLLQALGTIMQSIRDADLSIIGNLK
jgi:hypothetical protein